MVIDVDGLCPGRPRVVVSTLTCAGTRAFVGAPLAGSVWVGGAAELPQPASTRPTATAAMLARTLRVIGPILAGPAA